MNTSATARRRLGPRELAFILGVPAAWAILLLFHPLGNGEFSDLIDEDITAWITVHLGMGIFVPLFAAVVWLLLRGVEGPAATVSRVGLAVFALVYAAWELVLGVGSGILAHETKALPEAQQGLGADLIDAYGDSGVIFVLSAVGSLGLAVGMVAAALALRRAYGVGGVPLLLWVLSMPLIAIHEPPLGPVGLALFILAALLVVRRQQAAPVEHELPSTSRPPPEREGSRLPLPGSA